MTGGRFYIGVMNVDGSGERLLAGDFWLRHQPGHRTGVLMYFKQEPFRE